MKNRKFWIKGKKRSVNTYGEKKLEISEMNNRFTEIEIKKEGETDETTSQLKGEWVTQRLWLKNYT